MISKPSKSIFIAGHNGMVGSAIARLVRNNQTCNLSVIDKNKLDLRNQDQVNNYFNYNNFDEVYVAAAKVGGIYANDTYSAEFIYDNLMISSNIIHASFLNGVKKLLYLGSSCIYPKFSDQPIKEEYLLNGPLEKTNEAYSIAKIAGIKLCESYNKQYYESHQLDYRAVMPTNLYGFGDNYDDKNSHVIPALIRRIHLAKLNNLKSVKIWGTGKAKREFLFVDDFAEACIFVMNLSYDEFKNNTSHNERFINIGSGFEIEIKELAELIADIIGFKGALNFDTSMPDGTPRKLLDSSRLKKFGWKPKYNLKDGIKETYQDFIKKGF